MTFPVEKSALLTDPNPFFVNWNTPFGVPPFAQIRPEHFMPAYERAFAEHDAEIYLARTEALRAAGRTAEAEEIRQRGAERVRAIADGIVEPEWRTCFLERVAANRELLADAPT